MKEEKMKHLEFIQATITRMNQNSFTIKGWMVTLVAALLALYASSSNKLYIAISIVPVIVFWFLDTCYLQIERKFRGLYDDVAGINGKVEVKDFSMHLTKYKGGKYAFIRCLFSRTIWPLYIIVLAGLVTGFIIL